MADVRDRWPAHPAIALLAVAGLAALAAAVAIGLVVRPGGTAEPTATLMAGGSATPRPTAVSVASEAPRGELVPASAAAPSASTSATRTPAPETAWEVVRIDGLADVRGVAERDGRLVAVGSTGAHPPVPAIAWSDDGETWTSVDLSHLGPVSATLDGLVAGPNGFVASGLRFHEPNQIVAGVPFLLFSADGISWEEVAHPGGCTTASQAVTGEFGYLMVGQPACETEPAPDTRPFVVLSSADGRAWAVTSHDPPLADVRRRPGRLATDGTVVVGIGHDAALYWSDDGGGSWEARDDAFTPKFATNAVAYGHGTFVVTGSRLADPTAAPSQENQPVPMSCVSPDADQWECAGMPRWASSVLATSTGFVGFSTGPGGTAVVASRDGLQWSEEAAPELRGVLIHESVFATHSFGIFAAGGTDPGPGETSQPVVARHRSDLP